MLDGPVIEDNASVWNDDIFAMPSFDGVDVGSPWDTSVLPSAKELGQLGLFEPFIAPPPKTPDLPKSRKYIDVEKFIISMSPCILSPMCRINLVDSYAAVGCLPGPHAWIPAECG